MANQVNVKSVFTLSLAAASALYGLWVLWYVPTQPSLPLGVLLANSSPQKLVGVEIRDVSQLSGAKGSLPAVGDRLIEVAGRPIQSFMDIARVHRFLRHFTIGSEAVLSQGRDPSIDGRSSGLAVVEYQPGQQRDVKIWFLSDQDPIPKFAYVPLVQQPAWGVALTFVWYLLQFLVVGLCGLAFWNRPFDQPLRIFVVLSSLTLCAFAGGSHWWIIAADPVLIVVFTISAVFLPAVLLHFFLVYPVAAAIYSRHRTSALAALYALPTAASLVLCAGILSAWLLTWDWGTGPFADAVESLTGEAVAGLYRVLRVVIFAVFGVSLAYFLGSIVAIWRSLSAARNPLELSQVRFMFAAAMFALIPIGYTVGLAVFDHVRFALGAGRIPMFLAALAFMLAYGVGIARYRLMLIDQVVSKGVWYYGASAGLTLLLAALIATGASQTLDADQALFHRGVPLLLVLTLIVLVMVWARDALQKSLDRRFFSQKYQLDKSLEHMNQVVSGQLEPEAVSEHLLHTFRDILHIEVAALYLRKGNRLEFRMLTAIGGSEMPFQIGLDERTFEQLAAHEIVQRVGHPGSPSQEIMRILQAEAIHGLEIQGQLGGFLVLGCRPNSAPFSAEDLAFVAAMARISGIALHCAAIQKDLLSLNDELQLKAERIEDQDRQISALRQELAGISGMALQTSAELEFDRSEIRGNSPAMLAILETVRKVAHSQSSVLVRGESGTGKELLARAIHRNSPRRNGPLVVVHCAALSPALLESELFGHVKGAFTDARQDKIGRFQLADGGTLFLDEIGDISLEIQIKLLRVLQERTFEPVGSNESRTVDVRIIAATHQNLEKLIAQGRFREDLFYRLNVISITLPPLRDRGEDMPELVQAFLRSSSEKAGKQVLFIDSAAMKALRRHPWPGNIRELQNVIERAVVLAEGDTIRSSDLPLEVQESAGTSSRRLGHSGHVQTAAVAPASVGRKATVSDDSERQELIEALLHCAGNKAEAARLLGLPRSTFFSKLKKHGLG